MNKQKKMRMSIAVIADIFNYIIGQSWFVDKYDSIYDYIDTFHTNDDDVSVARSILEIYDHNGKLISKADIAKSWCGRPAIKYRTESSIIDYYTVKNNIDYEWLTVLPDKVLPEGRNFVFILFEEDEVRIVSVNPYKGKMKEGNISASIPFEEREKIIKKQYVF